MGKFKELRDQLDQVAKRQKQAAKTFATKLDQHASRVNADINRESKNNAQRIVKLEKRVADLERRLRKQSNRKPMSR
jgi:cell division septum initiation protein DivIVA